MEEIRDLLDDRVIGLHYRKADNRYDSSKYTYFEDLGYGSFEDVITDDMEHFIRYCSDNNLTSCFELKSMYSRFNMNSLTLCLKRIVATDDKGIMIDDDCECLDIFSGTPLSTKYKFYIIEVVGYRDDYYVWDVFNCRGIMKLSDYLFWLSSVCGIGIDELRVDTGYLLDFNIDSDNLINVKNLLNYMNGLGINEVQFNIHYVEDLVEEIHLSNDCYTPFSVGKECMEYFVKTEYELFKQYVEMLYYIYQLQELHKEFRITTEVYNYYSDILMDIVEKFYKN